MKPQVVALLFFMPMVAGIVVSALPTAAASHQGCHNPETGEAWTRGWTFFPFVDAFINIVTRHAFDQFAAVDPGTSQTVHDATFGPCPPGCEENDWGPSGLPIVDP